MEISLVMGKAEKTLGASMQIEQKTIALGRDLRKGNMSLLSV